MNNKKRIESSQEILSKASLLVSAINKYEEHFPVDFEVVKHKKEILSLISTVEKTIKLHQNGTSTSKSAQ